MYLLLYNHQLVTTIHIKTDINNMSDITIPQIITTLIGIGLLWYMIKYTD